MKTKIKNRIRNYIYDRITEYLNFQLCNMIRNEFKEVDIKFNHYKKMEYTEILANNHRILVYKWSNVLYNIINFEGYKNVITKSLQYKNII
jgi:hypothetical protein